MMRKVLLFSFIFLSFTVFAQPNDFKRDYIWQFGYDCNNDTGQVARLFGVKNMDFNTHPPSMYLSCPNIKGFTFTRAHICDTLGNLELTTNGYVLHDGHGNRIDSFGLDAYYSYSGRDLQQSSLFLPFPEQNNDYVLLDLPFVWNNTWNTPGRFNNHFYIGGQLYYHQIIKTNNQYQMVARNQPVFSDTLEVGMQACRHANGRDWWILIPKAMSNVYHRWLLSSTGLQYIGSQGVGQFYCANLQRGQTVFSPDGTMYARIVAQGGVTNTCSLGGHLRLYDFDRCTGLLAEKEIWRLCCGINPFEDPYSTASGGVAFSSNSRYLYANSEKYVYQIDTRGNPMTIDTVGRYSGESDTIGTSISPTVYMFQQLAPNDKIYISSDANKYIHIIENPNASGILCNVQNKAFHLGIENAWGLPNYPNFRLGRLEGSGCDTIYSAVNEVDGGSGGFKVYPNPNNQGYFVLEWTNKLEENGLVRIIDMFGREVYTQSILLSTGKAAIKSQQLLNGTYLISVQNDQNELLHSEKVVIVH
jgi:Secretion system C-terminal sorting domain